MKTSDFPKKTTLHTRTFVSVHGKINSIHYFVHTSIETSTNDQKSVSIEISTNVYFVVSILALPISKLVFSKVALTTECFRAWTPT